MSSPAIVVQRASLIYNSKFLFHDLNFYLPAGKITCLLGPSGVGKTSVLRMIAGVIPSHDFTASVMAEDKLPLHGRIAYMGQTDLLLPWLTAIENIVLGSRLRRENKKESYAHAFQVLAQLKMEESANKYPNSLSGGMRQRIALARTLFEDRPIVLMDEPFSSVDAITRMSLQVLTTKLLFGRTVLLVTHDLLEALRMADRIYIMQGLPAHCDFMIEPPGKVPRDINDPALLNLQRMILNQLHLSIEVSDEVDA